ncbi:MAG TPA: hypothetical protein VLI39_15805 [Sedimentisphaerales bacterium]|nr:hypothetical protein [Sedimentisphaerales bacterium]
MVEGRVKWWGVAFAGALCLSVCLGSQSSDERPAVRVTRVPEAGGVCLVVEIGEYHHLKFEGVLVEIGDRVAAD